AGDSAMMRRGGPTEDELILASELERERLEAERGTPAPAEPEFDPFRTEEHVVPASRLKEPAPGPSMPPDARRTTEVENKPPTKAKPDRKPSRALPLLLAAVGGLAIGGGAVWFLAPPSED